MNDTITIGWPLGHLVLTGAWQQRFDSFTGEPTKLCNLESANARLEIVNAPNGELYCSATVSLPKFAHGSNTTLLDPIETPQKLQELAELVSEKVGQKVLLEEARVWKVHFARDLRFAEADVPAVLMAMSEMEIRRFKKASDSSTSVYFHSHSKASQNAPRTICLYSKHHERLDKNAPAKDIEASRGQIRIEYRLNTSATVRSLVRTLGLPDSRVLTIVNQDVAKYLLDPIEECLRSVRVGLSPAEVLRILSDEYGLRRAHRLFTFLVLLRTYGPHFYRIETIPFSRTAYYECASLCRAVGLYSSSSPSSTVPLLGNN